MLVVTASKHGQFKVGFTWMLGVGGNGEELEIEEDIDSWCVEDARPATPEEETIWRLTGKP